MKELETRAIPRFLLYSNLLTWEAAGTHRHRSRQNNGLVTDRRLVQPSQPRFTSIDRIFLRLRLIRLSLLWIDSGSTPEVTVQSGVPTKYILTAGQHP